MKRCVCRCIRRTFSGNRRSPHAAVAVVFASCSQLASTPLTELKQRVAIMASDDEEEELAQLRAQRSQRTGVADLVS